MSIIAKKDHFIKSEKKIDLDYCKSWFDRNLGELSDWEFEFHMGSDLCKKFYQAFSDLDPVNFLNTRQNYFCLDIRSPGVYEKVECSFNNIIRDKKRQIK